MDTIIESLDSIDLIPAMDRNLVSYWASYSRGPQGIQHAADDIFWQHTGMHFSLPNGVFLSRMTEADVPAVVNALQAEIDRHNTAALWYLSPATTPANLKGLLAARGLTDGGETPALAVDLGKVDDSPNVPENFSLRLVRGPEMQYLWAKTACLGFGFPEKQAAEFCAVERALDDAEYNAQLRYIGYLGEKPVATSCVVWGGGLAGIYAVSTLAEARGKGIGRWMTLYPLLEGRKRGYKVGILQASSMGYPIYRRIGFEDIFKYQLFIQSPA